MIRISPGTPLKLWLIYEENGEKITGLTNLSCTILDQNNNIILNQALVENVLIAGEYYYFWNTSSVSYGTYVTTYYYKGTEFLYAEEFYFEDTESGDGVAS